MEQLLKNQDTESYKGDYYAIERSKKSLVVSKVDNSDEMIKWIKPAPNKPWILNNLTLGLQEIPMMILRRRQ